MNGQVVQGEHKCKFHNYEHSYVRHVCGHEYCSRVWKSCPRCYGSHSENEVNPLLCSACGSEMPVGQSCGCFDNGSE